MGWSSPDMFLGPSQQQPQALGLFLMLAMGHFLGDFALQSDRMAREKCPGDDVTLPFYWWLVSHAAIHGFLVGMITGVPMLGLGEWVAHALTDIGKCRRCYHLSGDQAIHLATKLCWTWLAVQS